MDYRKLAVPEFLEVASEIDVADFHARLFERIGQLNKNYNLLITVAKEQALPALKTAKAGALHRLPVSAKDSICTAGIQSTAGSRILEGYIPLADATAVTRLKEQGGVIVGKTNQDEFGFGTFATNSGYGPPKNPLDPLRSCGGSSGGAAGLVQALDFPHLALAESTGGSITAPASFCGVVGLTPTYGLVSRSGLIDYANSLDKIGCMGKNVQDAALLLSAIAGPDAMDPTTALAARADYSKVAAKRKLKIAIPKEYLEVEDGVKKAFWNCIHRLEAEGAKYSEVSLPTTEYAVASYYVIAASEASTNLAKFCGMRYGREEKLEGDYNSYFSATRTKYLGSEAKRRMLLGTFARMAGYRDQYYAKALQVRRLIIEDFKRVLNGVDAIMAPSMPITAPKFAEIEKLTPLENYMLDILTVGPNLAGLPHASIPCGTVRGLPAGIQIIGGHFQEQTVLAAARQVERA